MLNFMRSKISGVLGILLIALLVFAFGLWGVADTFTGFSNEEIAQVGDQKIDRQEYQLRFMQRTQSLSQQLGTNITPSMARNRLWQTRISLAPMANSMSRRSARSCNKMG